MTPTDSGALALGPGSWGPDGTADPLAQRRDGLVGAPVSRLDGPLKVTGAARFAAGAGAAEIAAAVHLSYGTVRNYLASAVTKLGARNRVDAVRIAAEAGWL